MIVRYALKHDNFAELHARLGGVPLHRILTDPPPGTATEDDVIRYIDGEPKRLVELVDGTLVEKAMGYPESLIGAHVNRMVGNYVARDDLGLVAAADGSFRLSLGKVRLPDVSFVPWENVPEDGLPDEQLSSLVPSFVVEVLSPSNTAAEIDRKMVELFAAGCRLAWVLDPETRTAEVLTSPKRRKTVSAGMLDGGKVLPGFTLNLAEAFAAGEKNRKRKKK